MHHAGTESSSVLLRRVSRQTLQAHAGRQSAGRRGQVRQAAEAVRLDPRDRLPFGKRDLCCGAFELANPEAYAASGGAPDVQALRSDPRMRLEVNCRWV